MVFGRMRSDRELLLLSAAGVAPWRVFIAVIPIGLLVASVSWFGVSEWGPDAYSERHNLQRKALADCDCIIHLAADLKSRQQRSNTINITKNVLEAMRHAQDCLGVSESTSLSPFYMAYAHEAITRAAVIGGDMDLARSHLSQAVQFSGDVSDAENKKLIDADLKELQQKLS